MKPINNKKYTGIWDTERKLYRITRKSDGTIGGWIEKESNLSEKGDCFVYDNAEVLGNAVVYSNAKIYDSSRVFGDTEVSGNAVIYGNAMVCGNAMVYSNARVYDSAVVFDSAMVCGNAEVSGDARIYDSAIVCGNAMVCGSAEVFDSAVVHDRTTATKRVFSLLYDRYIITGTDNHLRIGCKQFTYEEWWNFTDDEIDSMDEGALKWWRKWKPILMAIFKENK